MRHVLLAGALALTLTGCQTVEQSQISAEYNCEAAGLRPGTARYNRCRQALFAQNRRDSDAAAGAVVAGAAAGLLVGGAIAASSRPYYYGPGYYWY
jgi:hypothetical protein